MNLPLNVRIALGSLSAHKLRAILAMLGVFLGALAFTGVQHASMIMVRSTEIETEKMGPNLYAVIAGQIRFRHGGDVHVDGSARTFTLADAEALAGGVPSVLEYTPFSTATLPVRYLDTTVPAGIVAANPNYVDIRSFHPQMGRFFTWEELEERAKVCVLGQKIAQRLFSEPEKGLGKDVYMYRAGFRVVGIMEPKGRDLSGADQDEVVLMPLTTYLRRASNNNWINGVFLRLAPDASLDMVDRSVREIMRFRHNIAGGEDEDFSLLSAKDVVQLQRQTLDLVQTLGGIASSISFGVGGLGILSIMILVVRSRRIEIGIRRAVGGRRRDIVRQFLFESAILAGVGGSAGVAVSVALVLIVGATTNLPIVLDPTLIVGTLVASGLLGVGAGAYPAWQAAQIEILDVLKI